MKLRDRAQAIVSGPRIRYSVRAVRERVGWGELVTLAAILVCSGGLWVFAELVDATLEGETHAFDEAVLNILRTEADADDPIGPDWVEIVFQDLTALGGFAVITLFALMAIGYLTILRRWGTIALIVASLVGGTVLNNLLKNVFDRPRPDLVSHLVEVHTMSFPSGHAMLSAVAYLTIGALLAQVQPQRRIKIYVLGMAVTLTVLVGFSRVYLGVHWPTDVLAGWCIGAAWAMMCWLIARFAAVWRARRAID